MEISGATRLLGIVGDPITQVRTPSIMNPIIRTRSINAVLVPLHVPEPCFEKVMPGLLSVANLDGLVITYPFKERALKFVPCPTRRAVLVQGVNAMTRTQDGRWIGDMFDGLGLLRAVECRRTVAGAKVLLVGAGGAGRAIGFAFAEAGAALITVVDLDLDRARELVERLAANFPDCRIAQGPALATGHDIIVNATPVGMNPGDGLAADLGPFSPAMTAADVVLASEPTAFVRAATAGGAIVVSGVAMTEAQAGAILEFFGIRHSAGAREYHSARNPGAG